MAKKKHKKKHNFQHKGVAQPAARTQVAATHAIAKPTATAQTMPNEWADVADDVKRALILAGVFILIMIALWYFLDVSVAGKNFYNSIKL